tara:strand:+ start:10555 stop:11364 length:810 start_codon:yes stop_codon:yes gene_type:complete
MQRIIDSILYYKDVLVFLILLLFSIYLVVDSNHYHQSKLNSISNNFTSIIFEWSSSIENYFNLKDNNEELIQENLDLINRLYSNKEIIDDSLLIKSSYIFSSAKIINNNFSYSKNYLIIDKGSKDGIKEEMGVVNSYGIIGITVDVSENYSRVMSILNLNSKINAKIKNSFHFGSLEWNGEDPSKINLNDVPKIAKIKIGDSIVSGGMSSIFPENLPIGVVSKIDLKNSENYYGIDVLLNNDMTSIKNVYIINNPDKKEIDNLKNLINE